MDCVVDTTVAYIIDSSNRITWVCQHWWPFARDNDAPELHPDNVLGKDLLAFISDSTSRQLYRLALDRVRQTGEPISFDIRCDGPDRRRFLSVRMSTPVAGEVLFESNTQREEPRPPVDLLKRHAVSPGPLVRLCSWCKRVAVGDAWLEIEHALQHLNVMVRDIPPDITHGMCPSCSQTVMATIPRSRPRPNA